jgi:hypothetical protein
MAYCKLLLVLLGRGSGRFGAVIPQSTSSMRKFVLCTVFYRCYWKIDHEFDIARWIIPTNQPTTHQQGPTAYTV